MENTVKLFKITQTKASQMSEQGEWFSLKPYGDNTDYNEGYDDGGKDYILPEGYKLAESNFNEFLIYDHKGEYCSISNKSGNPCLTTSIGEKMLTQEK